MVIVIVTQVARTFIVLRAVGLHPSLLQAVATFVAAGMLSSLFAGPGAGTAGGPLIVFGHNSLAASAAAGLELSITTLIAGIVYALGRRPGVPLAPAAGLHMSDDARCLACGGPLSPTPVVVAPDRMHRIPGSWAVHECATVRLGHDAPLVARGELAPSTRRHYAPFDVPPGALARAMAPCSVGVTGASRWPTGGREGVGHAARRRLRPRRPGRLVDRRRVARAGCRAVPAGRRTARRRGAEIVGRDARERPSRRRISRRGRLSPFARARHRPPARRWSGCSTSLRPGGRLAVIVPNWGSWQRRAFGEYWFPLELPRHRTHFTANGLASAIGEAGFEGT